MNIKNRLTFPLFNMLVCSIFGALIGYYISRQGITIFLGGVWGLALGLGANIACLGQGLQGLFRFL